MTSKATKIAEEARRQEESCLYTSTILYLWLRQVRCQNTIFIVTPIILGALAGFSVLKDVFPDWVTATLALFASLFPALASGLNIQTSIDEIAANAAAFKSLQDRFRQLAEIVVSNGDKSAQAELRDLMDKMDIARANSITPPERYFEKARKKIEAGDYSFAVDARERTEEAA